MTGEYRDEPCDTPTEMAVDVLRCKSCGAPVALGTGDVAKCPHCATETEIPEEHKALREADARASADRVAAAKLVRRVGRLPSWPLRAAAWTWSVLMFIVTLPITIIIGYQLGGRLLRWWAERTDQHLHDVVMTSFSDPSAMEVALGYGSTGMLFALWIVLSAYGGRQAVCLRELQAGLAAGPAERTGGPRTCRACGAPLDVPAGALSVTCLYCRADNLVAIPASWLAKAKGRAEKLGNAIEEASKAYLKQLRTLRLRLIIQLSVLVVIAGGLVVMIGSAAFSGPRPTYEYDWHRDVTASQLRRDARYGKGMPKIPAVSRTECGSLQTFGFGRGDCSDGACVMHYYIALRKGDTLFVRGTEMPWKTLAAFEEHIGNRPFDQAKWGERIGKPAWIGGDREATFRAPHDGWFMLWIGALEGATELTPYRLCVRVPR